MNFVNHKIAPELIESRAATLRAGFAAMGNAGDFEASVVAVFARRLKKRPADYLEFGPYWWAVKQVLIDAGHDLGTHGDPLVAAEYRGASALGTLVAAEEFKDQYRQRYFVGHNTYDLADDGGSYELFDPDMAERLADAVTGLAR